MTHDAREKSRQDGEPLELYKFTRSSSAWHYTSAKNAVTYGNATWEPAAIQRSKIEHTGDKGRGPLKLTVPRDFPIADLFRIAPPTDVILVTLTRLHAGEAAGAVIWMGRVTTPSWSGARAVITCEPAATALARPGLRRMYQRSCPHVLYGPACGVNKAAHAVTVTLDSVLGTAITSTAVSAYQADHFAGGFLEFTNTRGFLERRFLHGNSGSAVSMNMLIPDLAAGSQVTLFPGCNHTLSACASKFGNGRRYGGWPYIPRKNPYAGSSIY